MVELLLCSLFTILPDYLYRRYAQGKRLGHEITLYSVWYELRWGITSCLMLTVLLITLVFYYHPSTTAAASFFRAVPIVPEVNGRVAEVLVDISDEVEQGQPIFVLDDAKQKASVATLKSQVTEIDAQMGLAKSEIATAEGQLRQAKGAYKQASDELRTKRELFQRNANVVSTRELEDLETLVDTQQGAVDAAEAAREEAELRLDTLLPAQKASAEAALAEAEVQLEKTVVRAGVSGRVEQFTLRPGDFVTALGRPAGVLIPEDAGHNGLVAGFGQIEAQVIRVGMIGEAACPSMPLSIVPLKVIGVQDYIASGQVNAGQQLLDPANLSQPGSILVRLEPLYDGTLSRLPPGSNCIVNLYSDHHAEIASGEAGFWGGLYLHMADAVGLVHAAILRIQTLLLPIQTLVISGEH
ncbi:biotin/lipoyl-binding protein [Methyloligella sp. 2.7D]|uniref:HlyD family secretion protein n=1 Tax=unclassified Methyloligella TaxID=2625955 RepID=UPI00157D61C7|nr:biotin/lipoyl-binding protein [Methyloligella sp. GL2]QKP76116.1 HlyD family secretion protein [Methyloligella sp. GL2]